MHSIIRSLALLALVSGGALVGCGSDDTGAFYFPPDRGGDGSGDPSGPGDGSGQGSGSGEGTGEGSGGEVPSGEACEAEALAEASVLFSVYVDIDASERTIYDTPSGDDVPEPGVTVNLLGEAAEQTAVSCAGGEVPFVVRDGIYLRDVETEELCRTRNCARRLPDAVREGTVRIITAGDSVPVLGASRTFPDRLAELMSPLATIDSQNLAEPGTVSEDWVPGSSLFETRIRPQIAEADVVIVSLGGNDILEYAGGALQTGDVQGALNGVSDFVRGVMERVLLIKDAIEQENPDIDFVYLLYPDYASSSTWADQFGFVLNLIGDAVVDALEQILDELPMEEDVIVADLYGHFRNAGLELGEYLDDPLHFNDPGQEIITEVIFRAVGGVRVGPDAIGVNDRIALEP